MNNSNLVKSYLRQIWNESKFDLLGDFLHKHYVDYSLPGGMPSGAGGTKKWIQATGQSFSHKTIVERIVCEGSMVMARISMNLMHHGIWRNIQATGMQLTIKGYREFEICDGKIIGHWALIDGENIERAISNSTHSCKI